MITQRSPSLDTPKVTPRSPKSYEERRLGSTQGQTTISFRDSSRAKLEPGLGDSGISLSEDKQEVKDSTDEDGVLPDYPTRNGNLPIGIYQLEFTATSQPNHTGQYDTADETAVRKHTEVSLPVSPNAWESEPIYVNFPYRPDQWSDNVSSADSKGPTDTTNFASLIPLAMSSPVTSDGRTPTPSPTDTPHVPPQLKTPAPVLERGSIKRGSRSSVEGVPVEGGCPGAESEESKVVEVSRLTHPPGGMVNGLRVLPLSHQDNHGYQVQTGRFVRRDLPFCRGRTFMVKVTPTIFYEPLYSGKINYTTRSRQVSYWICPPPPEYGPGVNIQ